MLQDVSIRVASPERDTAQMLEIYAHSIATSIATFETGVPTPEDFANRIRTTLKTHPWLVAESDEGIVGYAYGSQHRPRIGYRWTAEVSVYVKESAGGRGIGTVLYQRLIALLRTQGFRNLLAIISIPNPASEALHEKMGFSKVGQFDGIGYKFGQWQQTCWWQAQIGNLDESPKVPIPFAELDSGAIMGLLE